MLSCGGCGGGAGWIIVGSGDVVADMVVLGQVVGRVELVDVVAGSVVACTVEGGLGNIVVDGRANCMAGMAGIVVVEMIRGLVRNVPL